MKKSSLEIYALAVCFFTVACFVITLGLAAWHVVELAAPKFTIAANDYEHHQSDEAYRDWLVSTHSGSEKTPYVPPEGAALTAAKEKSLAEVVDSQRRRALQDFVQNLFFLFIYVVVFAVHWRIAAHARRNVA